MNLHTCFNKDFSITTAAQIGCEVQRTLAGVRCHGPVLVMHWVEEPSGRVAYHWDIEMPQADFTAH
ncbi:hypothetical protein [Acidocella sp.]|uniref:hypothetical protein n=1 Tax=Acidocella sp. TaxID=50710 RepID=UPI001826958E|nr:hypothetical protein [Acidocella sp.]NNM56463.1 hypothetical protein [Acidocella sp.]